MDWKEKLAQCRAASEMRVTTVSLDAVGGGWSMQEDGSFRRSDSKFFLMLGLSIQAKREVSAWGQPALTEAGSGVYVLVTDETRSWFLVSMRHEPGNPSANAHILLGPSLQASLSNYEAAHGGKKPPRAEFYDDPRMVWIDAPKDGGRFVTSSGNCNRMGVLTLPSEEFDALVPTGDELIMTRDELREAILAGECNAYLRESAGAAILLAS